MQPFDYAWRLLKSYTSYPPLPPGHESSYPSAHLRLSSEMPPEEDGRRYSQRMGRPTEFENRQFNVKNIDDEDTSGRVRDTYQELDPANFSTGDDMGRRLSASTRGAQEGDPDDFDYRPIIEGMRVNENPNYPTLSRDDMDPRLKYPYPKDANNPGDFAGGY